MPYVNGLRYREYGKGKKGIVLLHGLTGSIEAWEAVGNCLAMKGFHAVALELPGHGKSRKIHSWRELQPERLAGEIWSAIEEIGMEKAMLATHSFSNLVQPFIPSKAKAMVSVPANSPEIRLKRLLLDFLLPFSYLFPCPADRTTSWDFSRKHPDFDIHGFARSILKKNMRNLIFGFAQKIPEYKPSKRCVIIHGTKDTITPPSHAIEVAKKTGCPIKWIEGNHLLPINNWRELCGLLSKRMQ